MRGAGQFLRFCAVGLVGFLVDAGLLLAAVGLGLPPLAGRLLSWLAAASTTFALNRIVTFGDAAAAPVWRRWLLFLAANGLGGAVNYGVFGLVLGVAAPTGPRLVVALAAGTLAGLALNFWLSRRVVFRPAPHTVPGRVP
ncbi:GtrA family protein [Methylobacterium terricola]|uniref:GtrA family protein n=1 Tax=Methylobacterium terricola TaxID=2583531 RepID=A0A5C4LF32_9HYPH|nr:GtrA family protein [Methylobacterium terricola]TNC10230.1 GtrA family protein [Methylobacterium terricola]